MRNKLIVLACVCVSQFVYSQTPNWLWSKKAGGAQADSVTSSVTDGIGNTYVVGYYYSSTITFGGITLTNANSSGFTTDGFLVKYNTSGGVIWAKNITGIYNEYVYDVCINSSGAICIAGKFNSSSVSYGSIGSSSIGFGYEMFYVKYDAGGNDFFAQTFLGGYDKEIDKISYDAAGNIYVAGVFSSVLGVGGPTTMYSNGGIDIFILKIDNTANPVWYKNIGGAGNDYIKGLAVDSLNNVVISGIYQSAVINVDTLVLSNESNNYDLFIARFDSIGNIMWAKSPDGEFPDFNYNLISNSIGQTFMAGQYMGPSAVFDSIHLYNTDTTGLTTDIFVVKYDASGNLLWAKTAAGDSWDFSYDLCKDKNGNIYIAGSFHGNVLDLSSTVLNNISNDSTSDFFVVKYDSMGNLLWALKNGGIDNDKAKSISVNSSGNIYIVGMFKSSSIIFGGSSITNSTTNYDEIFIAKLASSVVGIENLSVVENNVVVFPNPSNGVFYFTNLPPKGMIEVYDLSGRKIFQTFIDDKKAVIDLSENSSGIYFYKIKNESEYEVSGKLIVH